MAISDASETILDLRTAVLGSNDAETKGDTQPASGGYVSQLKPPIGTTFFKEDHVTIFNNEEIFHWIEPLGRGGGHKTKVGSITWRASIYTYVSGASPGGDFEKHNGSILILIIHSGSVQISGFGSLESTRRVTGPSSTTPKVQLPPSSSGNQRGQVWDYNISYHETLPMFKNGGNDTFNFEAKYGEDFSIEGAQQSSKELDDGWETCVKYERGEDRNHTIANLTAFTTKVQESPLTFQFTSSHKPMIGYLTSHHKTIEVQVNLKNEVVDD